ncbi:MAG: four helix bundle protein [Planctomycetaceae bacterium]|jgi:four helix bundle protein|nr:four helix bundle protein [Planctomycetaceae bacterium]
MAISKSYRDLIVWQKSIELTGKIYSCTRKFPKDEMYGIISQMRRAAVSIASNIAEGQGRNSTGEFRQFLGTSKGSLYELETQLIVSQNVGYLSKEELNDLLSICAEIGRLINGLIKSLEQ